MKQSQSSGDGTSNQQAGRDIINNGYSSDDVTKLTFSLFEQMKPFLVDVAAREADRRVALVINDLGKLLVDRNESFLNKFKDPAVHILLSKINRIALKKDDSQLRTMCLDILMKRLENDSSSDLSVAFDEAMSVIAKLSQNQLKILAVVTYLRYIESKDLSVDADFKVRLSEFLQLLFEESQYDFMHLSYCSCCDLEMGSWRLESALLNNHPSYFKKEDGILMTPAECKIKVESFAEGKILFDYFYKSKFLKHARLTSIGILIGSLYLEKSINLKINLSSLISL
jgi:hypothetical protein